MIYETNKQRGNAGLSLAVAYYGCNDYTVSLPLNDTQDYDLIVDKDNTLFKVQVKFTSYQDKNGSYGVNLKSAGGTKGKVYKTVKDTDVDILFVVCSDKTLYEIPMSEVKNSSGIYLRKEPSKFGRGIDYSRYIVEI